MSNTINIYEEITNKILAEMEKGKIPWHKPWHSTTGSVSHMNGKPYSLLNQIILGITCERAGAEFITFPQIQKEGGRIKKGEKSSKVVFWKIYEKQEQHEDGTIDKKNIPILRFYNVWEVDQCEGIKRKYDRNVELNEDIKPIERAEKIVADYFKRETCKLRVREGDTACYSMTDDVVSVPMLSQYDNAEEYYSTIYHEMGHSTGHTSRLNRDMNGRFGSTSYSKEELVAELTSAFLTNMIGIDTDNVFTNSAAYIQGWSNALKEDKYLFVSASSKAEAASMYILNGKKEKEVQK